MIAHESPVSDGPHDTSGESGGKRREDAETGHDAFNRGKGSRRPCSVGV